MTGTQTQQQKQILTVVLVPVFMALLSVSIINVVLPSIGRDLAASSSALQWVLTGYTLAFGVMLVPAGRAGDVYGRGRLFVLGCAVFGTASLLAGLAPNALVLNIARILMGFGSGLLNPQTIGLIQQYFSGPERGRAFGLFGSTIGVSVAVGPVLGGVFVALFGTEWGWRVSFLINVPFAVTAVAAALRLFPASAWRTGPSERSSAQADRRADLDPIGTVLLAAAVLLIMLPFMERGLGLWIFSLSALGAALVACWVLWEKRYKARGRQPMVDLALFEIPSFANGALLIGLNFMGVTSVWVISVIFLQVGHGFSALEAGCIGLPGAIGSVWTSYWAGKRVVHMGRALVFAGLMCVLTGLLGSIAVVWAASAAGLSVWWLMLTLALVGASQGLVVSPNQTLTLIEVPVGASGAAGGIVQTGQRIGTAIGIAFITAILFAAQSRVGWDGAFMLSFAVIGVIVCLAALVAVYDIVSTRRATSNPRP